MRKCYFSENIVKTHYIPVAEAPEHGDNVTDKKKYLVDSFCLC